MTQQIAIAKPAEKAAEPRLADISELLSTMELFSESLARRAFEMFERRGRQDGNDLEDWLRAEAELFHTAHLDVADLDDAIAVRAELPGFCPEELEVSIEPRRLTIIGKRTEWHAASRRTPHGDRCADRVFRAATLPVEVNPQKSTAVLKDGILELRLPKVASERTIFPDRVCAIVRLEDHRDWTKQFARLFDSLP